MRDRDGPTKANAAEPRWHALQASETLNILQTSLDMGLGPEEVEHRRQRFGANRLTPQSERTTLKRLLSQFNNLFIYLLLAAAAVTALLGEWLDSIVILGVVLIIAIIGFVQEGQAERALEAVRGMLAPKARVLREGRVRRIPAEEVVLGDVILLEAGEQAPADIRLVRATNLRTQEAALTGESTAVEKDTSPIAEQAELADRTNMVYSATLVVAGAGRGVAVAIGDASEIGRISGMLSGIEQLKTPLMNRLDAFTRTLSAAILVLASLTFVVGVSIWNSPWADMFFAAVAIAVAAIPEGLPAVMTVTLALGVRRMARRNAIIRRLPAVETLGSVTIICSDKTGTFTKNEMTAKTLRTADADIEAEGVGYVPQGEFRMRGAAINLKNHRATLDMIRTALLCNEATLHQDNGEWRPEGDPTEASLIVLAHKAGFDPDRENAASPRVDQIPFASERRYMATLHEDGRGSYFLAVKGAPERVLDMCTREQRDETTAELDAEVWRRRADKIAERGQRVLAVARKELKGRPEALEPEAEHGLTLLGLFGLIDPPREEAIEAVTACHRAGIRIKMITGDHELTAQAIARALGLRNPHESLTGRDIEALDEVELRRKAVEVDVFARANPEHKLRLVTALQAEHHVTAMTGDGVNDAPALKRANIGVAMGRKGTDAAREASEMVLADDNFASIERAVEEGRTVYDNLGKAIAYLLPTNGAEALVIVAAIMLGRALPITPVQILWINMITAATLGMALAWEQAEGDVMQRPPRRTDEPLLTGFMVWRVSFVSVLLLIGVGYLFLREQAREGTTLEFARTVAVNALVVGEIFYLWNARSLFRPASTWEGLFGSRVVLLAIGACLVFQGVFTYAPFMNKLFGTEPLDLGAWLRCLTVGLLVFVAVELEKLVVRSRGWPAARGAGRRHEITRRRRAI